MLAIFTSSVKLQLYLRKREMCPKEQDVRRSGRLRGPQRRNVLQKLVLAHTHTHTPGFISNSSFIVSECRSGGFRCKTGVCVQKAALLDGTIDCLDGEDESPKHTVSGENEGVVQFKYFLN